MKLYDLFEQTLIKIIEEDIQFNLYSLHNCLLANAIKQYPDIFENNYGVQLSDGQYPISMKNNMCHDTYEWFGNKLSDELGITYGGDFVGISGHILNSENTQFYGKEGAINLLNALREAKNDADNREQETY